MITLALALWIPLAQAETPPGANPAAPAPPGLGSMLPWLLGTMVLFYFLILRPQRSKDQQFRSMVDSLKEKDRIVTIGGIHGVVTGVQREAGTATIRVDESLGTKLRINTSAIAKVVTDEDSAETTKTA